MEKSGASKSQLYHYFADKDALLREAAALQVKRVLGTHRQFLESLDSMNALRRWRDAVLALNSQNGSLWARSSTSCRRAPEAREQSSETRSRLGGGS
jgi:TetR/AcrR family transcriptional repressor of nem operon